MRKIVFAVLGLLIVAGAVVYYRLDVGGGYFGKFSGSPIVEFMPNEHDIKLKAPLSFVDFENRTWDVPEGYVSNGASIPRAFWSLMGGPLDGPYRDASIIHDYYCEKFTEPWPDEYKRQWRNVHRAFYYGMRARGVPEIKAKTMYGAVYHFGPRWESEGNRVRSVAAMPTTGGDINSDEMLIDYVEKNNPSLDQIEGYLKDNRDVILQPRAWQQMRTE